MATTKNQKKIVKGMRQAIAHAKKRTLGTNPKDLLGAAKVPMTAFPAVAVMHGAHAMVDGRAKYGAWNWRENAVQADVYLDAAMRHIYNWLERRHRAKDSEVHELGHALACIGIVLDAEATGNLVDNRPPTAEEGWFDKQLDDTNAIIKRRKEAAARAKRKR